jgi:hypothetical protein
VIGLVALLLGADGDAQRRMASEQMQSEHQDGPSSHRPQPKNAQGAQVPSGAPPSGVTHGEHERTEPHIDLPLAHYRTCLIDSETQVTIGPAPCTSSSA